MSDTFRLVPSAIERFGAARLEQICARAGVDTEGPWSTEAFFRLWRAADETFDDAAAGLRFGAEAVAQGWPVPSTIALHAPHLSGAIAMLARYKHLTCPELVELDEQGDDAIVRYRWLQATTEVPRLLVDTTLSALAALAHRGTEGVVRPIRVELARRPTERSLLEAHFGCATRFGAAHDAMVFARPALAVPFVPAPGGAFAAVAPALEAQLTGEGAAERGQVRVAIARQLSEGRKAQLAAIARRLAISPRTLQRRLEGQGSSFQSELAGTRRASALRLLSATELDVVAISLMLGFAEPNSFTRAFRGWERTTPLRWRERQRERSRP